MSIVRSASAQYVGRHDGGHDAAIGVADAPVVRLMARRSTQGAAARQISMLAVAYLVVWSVFSCGVTMLQRVLAALLIVSPMMEVTSPAVGATLLLVAAFIN